MPDRLTGIEVFVASMKAGGLSAGARLLDMSPAMATKHLDALEQRLGVKLVHRSTRRLTLTDAGKYFLAEAESLLKAFADAESETATVAQVVTGRLRVAAPNGFGVMHIAPLVPHFTARYPNVVVELGLNDRHVDMVEEKWDAALRVGVISDTGLIAKKLSSATTVLVAAPAYLARRGTPGTVAELAAHNCLGYTLSPPLGTRSWTFGADAEVVVPIEGNFSSNNGEALISAAIAGLGIVYTPRFLACDAIREGRLVVLSLDVPTLDNGGVYALTHPSRRNSAKVRAWTDFLAEMLAPRIGDF